MKRIFALLAALLLFCGCSAEPAATTQSETGEPTKPQISFYDPNSDVEESTGGAVRAYPLGAETALGFRFMDRDLLLFTKDPQVELTTVSLLQGENLTVSKALLLDCALNPEDPHLLVDPTQLCYYNLEENSLVILDRGLNETRRIRLPDDVTSEPVISADLSHLYYCAGNEIRVLELESGLSRMLKQQECRERRLLGFHFGDTILETFVVDPNGAGAVDFVSAADGLSVGSDAQLLSLTSGSGRYLLQRQDGVVTETLVGDTVGEIKSLSLPAGWQCFEAFGANGVMMAGKGQLAFVSISSGKVTARVDLGDDVQISHAAMDPGGNAVWILGTDSHLQSQVLYRWDLTAGEVNENAVVLHERYSQENPDTAGIQAAANRAKLLADTNGLQIYVDNSFTQPEEYRVIPAFQGEALNVGLATLEATFARMPEGFFDKLRSVGKDGMIHVALVRQILNAADVPVDEGGLHYAVGGDHYVLLTVGGDLENRIYRELSHVMDAAVYGGSKAFDDWKNLNPEGFAYLGTYQGYESLGQDPLLSGENRAFVDAYSMTFAREDRAAVFAVAMESGNEQLFASPFLQAKLQRLCQGIREAFEWQETEMELPWEQYLTPQA